MPPKIQIKLGLKKNEVSETQTEEKEKVKERSPVRHEKSYRDRDDTKTPIMNNTVKNIEEKQIDEERGRSRKTKEEEDKERQQVEQEEEFVVEEPVDMMALMGFGGFGTTKNKKVEGTDHSGVYKPRKTEYRQYMNREKGFNRPLSPSATDRKLYKERVKREREEQGEGEEEYLEEREGERLR